MKGAVLKNIDVIINVGKENMENKHYDLRVVALASIEWNILYYQYKEGIKKQEFRYLLKTLFGLTNHKIKTIIETLLEVGVIVEKDNEYLFQDVKDPFVILSFETAKFCIDNLSALEFKIYCYFIFSKIEERYWYKTGGYFTIKELIKLCGYSHSVRNYDMFKEALNSLEDFGLIKYSHDGVTKPGFGGVYKKLYEVNEIKND